MRNSGPIIMLAVLFCCLEVKSQITQKIRGAVTDKVSQVPIPGAVVVLLGSDPLKASICDEDGRFIFENVPVGKHSLRATYVGYKEVVQRNLTLNSGKELVLNVSMEEEVTEVNEVHVTARFNKRNALNDMSAVSTRAFSVEETQKFAAAVNDPARMATSFAGVVAPDDGNNNISIRGNSPNGLLWRMEGVEIPNPNHFSNVGTSGGGISILSSQLLNNSDFSTGAFAAEYGNALSGVFDLKLRKGNNQKREYTFQAGVLGIDVAAEGPFKKGYGGSYLINYRYSTLSVLGKMGVPLGDAVTNFQDLSFNVNLPTGNLGTFSLFGFAGLSSQNTVPLKDSLMWKEDDFTRLKSSFYANTGLVGFSNTKLYKNGFLKTVLALSSNQNGYFEEELKEDYNTLVRLYEQKFVQDKVTLSSVYTHKFNAVLSMRSGVILNRLGFDLSQRQKQNSVMRQMISRRGSTGMAQGFSQLNLKLSPKLTSNMGVHYTRFFLNNTQSFEPRASLVYSYNNRNVFTAGYGLHSQVQPLGVYFSQTVEGAGQESSPNHGLGLSKAHHFVAGYDHVLTENSHIKGEIYYQHLFNVPVATDKSSSYSILNASSGYFSETLVNGGLGVNKGVEFTWERFLHKDLYWLLSGSFYDSRYRAANGNWYNTRFNTNFALSATIGKEWTLSERRKNRVIGCNLKSMYIGGFRYTPIDLQSSVENAEPVLVQNRAFEEQNPAYFRVDLRLSVKRNYRSLTTTLALDIQNATNHKNVGGQYFDVTNRKIKYWYQAPLMPILSYRLEF